MPRSAVFPTLAAALVTVLACNAAQAVDVRGGKDHPLIPRFSSATLVAYQAADLDEATVIAKPLPDENKPEPGAILTIEGKVTRNGYVIEDGKTAPKVMRSYERALRQANFETIFECSGWATCGEDLGRFIMNSHKMAPSGFPASFATTDRYILAKRETAHGTTHAVVLVMQDTPDGRVNVYQQVVETRTGSAAPAR